MREEYCEACETLKEDAYTFATNGVTTAVANRLKKDNGFASPSTVDTDCEALNIGNDCLIGGQEDTLENYDVCDIKVWLKESWANLHTMLKAMIAAICGLWENVHSLWAKVNAIPDYEPGDNVTFTEDENKTYINALVPSVKAGTNTTVTYNSSTREYTVNAVDNSEAVGDRVDCLKNGIANIVSQLNEQSVINAKTFVRYVRNLGESTDEYWETFSSGNQVSSRAYYMNASGTSYGSTEADRDYIVIVNHCFNVQNTKGFDIIVTWYSSAETSSISTIRNRRGQHPAFRPAGGIGINDMSWTLSHSVLVKKGHHLICDTWCYLSDGGISGNPQCRTHQISLTWIPATIEGDDSTITNPTVDC